MSLQGSLTIERMCQLAGVSKGGFYRYLRSRDLHEEEICVRSAIQGVAFRHDGHYGYRRITVELRRAGMLVNHKRVSRILREDSLIAAALTKPRKKPRPDMMVNLAGGSGAF